MGPATCDIHGVEEKAKKKKPFALIYCRYCCIGTLKLMQIVVDRSWGIDGARFAIGRIFTFEHAC